MGFVCAHIDRSAFHARQSSEVEDVEIGGAVAAKVDEGTALPGLAKNCPVSKSVSGCRS